MAAQRVFVFPIESRRICVAIGQSPTGERVDSLPIFAFIFAWFGININIRNMLAELTSGFGAIGPCARGRNNVRLRAVLRRGSAIRVVKPGNTELSLAAAIESSFEVVREPLQTGRRRTPSLRQVYWNRNMTEFPRACFYKNPEKHYFGRDTPPIDIHPFSLGMQGYPMEGDEEYTSGSASDDAAGLVGRRREDAAAATMPFRISLQITTNQEKLLSSGLWLDSTITTAKSNETVKQLVCELFPRPSTVLYPGMHCMGR